MKQTERQEYEDISYLLLTSEWRAWVQFLKDRAEMLTKKVLGFVETKDFDKAMNTVAIINDIKRQIDMFQQRKIELEEIAKETN